MPPHPFAAGDPPQPLRVLCVDDNHDVADMYVLVLALYGFDARACYDGPTALRFAGDFAPDACLIDLNMPGMDGDELAVALRASRGPIRLVAVTAQSDAEAARRIEAAGFHWHLVKPAPVADLIQAIGRDESATAGVP